MTDINNQNLISDHNSCQVPSQSGAVRDYAPSVQIPIQAVGILVDPLGVSKQSKGKRRGKKVAPTQQDLAYADNQEQSANGKGEEKASDGGGSTVLYVVGGLAVVGAGVALAGGSGSSPAPEPPKDTTAPTAPTVSLPTDTGSSSTDRITNNGRIDVGGLETGATWEYSTNGGTSWQPGSATSFTLTAGTYADGSVLVRQKDAAGNVSATGKPAGAVTVDATAPSVAIIAQVAGDGTVSAAEKAAGITLSGTGEAGSSVSVAWGTVTKTATVNTSGAWSVQFASTDVPADGATTVRVTLTDLAGNVSTEAQRAVTVDARVLIQGNIVAGPLVAGHGLTVSIFTSAGALLQSGVAVASNGSFSTRVSANLGDVLIAKVTDSSTGADYSDEATGAAKDLNAALFATVIVSDLSAPIQAQVNPVTTLAAIKAGLSADGSGTVSNAAAVLNANTLVAKAFGLDTVNVVPVPTNGGSYTPADLTAGEKLGAVLAALSGLDTANAGNTQTSLTFLAAQIGLGGQSISAEGLAALLNGAAAAAPRTVGKLEDVISSLLAATQQSVGLSIASVATDNVVSASELNGLVLTGTVATGATSVVLSLGSWTANAIITNGTWSYALSASDASALGSNGAKILVATAVLGQGQSVTSSRAILLDTSGPVATINMISGNDVVNAAEKLAGVVISGTAEAKSSILLTWGGVAFSTQANLAGSWTLTVPSAQTPASGNTTVSVVATDVNNNAGQAITRNVSVDTVAPAAAQLSVVATDQVVDILEQAQGVTFAGTAEANAQVVVQWGGSSKTVNANGTGAWSALFEPANVPADGVRIATITVSDAANNVATSIATVQVAATPYMALTKGAELIVTKNIFALSANGVSATSTSITISGLTNGEFRKGGFAITQFTLKDVQDGLVTFVHDNSVNAPTFNVAVSDGIISSAAKAAQIFFVPISLSVGLDDILTGTNTADLLIGGDGNDTIRGGQGNDVLYGHGIGLTQGLDNDIFVWGSGDAGLGATDVIRDFTAWNGTSGDKLDLTALLVGYQAGTSDISQWISVQNGVTLPGATGWDVGKTGTLLTIDIDGVGAGTVTQTIFLENVSLTTTNPNQLISGGVILA